MDGLSAAASVIAVIEISAKLLGVLGKYCKDARNTKKDIQRLISQVECLYEVLQSIQTFIDGKDETKVPGIQSLKSSLAQCKAQVQEVLSKLPEQKKILGWRRSLKWPFDKPQVQEILTVLESSKITLSNALLCNNLDISIRTGEKVETTNIAIEAAELRGKRQFLQSLEANGAAFDSNRQQHDPRCLKDTRTNLLNEIELWATCDNGPNIFWLRGMAGTGKSTISRTVAESFSKNKILGASFFFSRGDGERSRATKFFTTIASQLASSIAAFEEPLHEAIHQLGPANISQLDFKSQWTKLILKPLSKLDSNRSKPIIMVIDALDECDDEKDVRLIIDLLQSGASISNSIKLRAYITSRPESYISRAFDIIPHHINIALHDISKNIVQADINHFLHHEFHKIGESRSLPPDWITKEQIEVLTQKSDGLFIYAATVCRFINDEGDCPKAVLKIALGKANGESTTPDLDQIYLDILKKVILGKSRIRKFKELVGCLILLSQSFTVEDLAGFLGLHESFESVRQFLRLLSSVLDVPKPGLNHSKVRLLHLSFRDFLLDPDRCPDTNFQINKKETNKMMALRCISIMRETLRRDICGLGQPGSRIEDVAESAAIDENISEITKHACLYWVDYLKGSGIELGDDDEFHTFLKDHILHWLEALSLMRALSEGIRMIETLLSILDSKNNVYAFVYDAKRFIRFNRSIIEHRPLQVYLSCLLFSPNQSLIRRQKWDEIPPWIKSAPALQDDWDSCLQTLEGHSDSVRSIALSQDSKWLASGSIDKTIRLWDTATGANLATFEGHSDWVQSVAFSSDSKRLASSSIDRTIKLWDTATGSCLATFGGHLGSVESVAFSHDSKWLASSSKKTISLWDTTTRIEIATFEGHSDWVQSVVFSPDSKRLVSGSTDKTIKLWDTATGSCLGTLGGHLGSVGSVVFSHNGKQLASGSNDRTIKLWDTTTGTELATFEGHLGAVLSVAYSYDGKQLASGSSDKTIKLWDIVTKANLITFKGHSSWIRSIAFSCDRKYIASGSGDSTIKLWDTAMGGSLTPEGCPATEVSLNTSKRHLGSVLCVEFSHDGKQLASGSNDKTIKLWDTATKANLVTLKGHSSWVRSLAFSRDNRQIASGSDDSSIKFWNITTGSSLITEASLATLKGHLGRVLSVIFSCDGKQLVSGCDNNSISLWDIPTREPLATEISFTILKGHSSWVRSLAFSHDGKRLASGCDDKTIKLWDMDTRKSLTTTTTSTTLKGHSSLIRSLAFSQDGKQLASGSDDNTIRIWDATMENSLSTTTEPTTLKGHSGRVLSVAFSRNGKQLISGSGDNTIKIWDIVTDSSSPRYQDFLLLPSSFRLSSVCFQNNAIAIGTKSGHVFICIIQDSPENPPPLYFQSAK
ncbi:hypothetical protein TWF730_001711 [Orbilia blumenaviensis]|uniref:NACHT domain-containing protein n=1 Tax=Orbilia blumenaviensis TaxID=1796055 RepID=A0AAV9UIP2_9PEZI